LIFDGGLCYNKKGQSFCYLKGVRDCKMKKFKCFFAALICAAVCAIPVQAAYILELAENTPEFTQGLLAGYDTEGKLCYAERVAVQSDNGFLYVEPKTETAWTASEWKIHVPEKDLILNQLLKKEKPAGEQEPEQKPEQKPEQEPEQQPEQSTGIEHYPTAADAATAFMVVNKATPTIVEGEEVTELEVLFRGVNKKILVPVEKTLYSAPDAYAELAGEPISSLRCGDVIYCTTNMSGKLNSVELIFRPQKTDYVLDDVNHGNSFEQLFTSAGTVSKRNPVGYLAYGHQAQKGYQYAFGMIKKSKSGKYMMLCNEQGIASQDLEILLSDQTVVYTYDFDSREKLSVGAGGSLTASEIPKVTMDEDENILFWEEDAIRNYVLVRMNDGVALDAVVYLNYNL